MGSIPTVKKAVYNILILNAFVTEQVYVQVLETWFCGFDSHRGYKLFYNRLLIIYKIDYLCTMSKLRVGNKQNSFLNGEWAGHVRKDGKKITSGIRRAYLKKDLKKRLEE